MGSLEDRIQRETFFEMFPVSIDEHHYDWQWFVLCPFCENSHVISTEIALFQMNLGRFKCQLCNKAIPTKKTVLSQILGVSFPQWPTFYWDSNMCWDWITCKGKWSWVVLMSGGEPVERLLRAQNAGFNYPYDGKANVPKFGFRIECDENPTLGEWAKEQGIDLMDWEIKNGLHR